MSTQRYERIPVFTPGDRLKKAREAAGMSQDELAVVTGISRGTVSHLELDKAPLKVSYLNLWAMATQVPIEWIQTGIETPTPDGPDDGGRGSSDQLARLTDQKRSRTRVTDTRRYLAASALAA